MSTLGVIEGPQGVADAWSGLDWNAVQRHVRRLQARIVKALKAGNWHRVRCLQRLLARSWAAKLLAVKRVCSNRGKRTAGVDGVILDTPAQRWRQAQALNAKGYRPQPLRRIYIPKKNGKRRALGIPTQADRAEQALEQLALDPVSETQADPCSYGFRQGRSTQDAIEACFNALSRRNDSAEWILEGDIRACFDTLSHRWLIEHIPTHTGKLRAWLNAGYMEKGAFQLTTEGTPQGGILSPTAANMALDGLERALKARFRRHHKVHLVRYADDCAPRRRTGGRKPSVQPCCTRDEGRPLEAAVQAEASNHPLLLPSREVVVRELGKGRARPGQVRTVESNASEPLMKCRKRRNGVKTEGESLPREECGGDLSTARTASGIEAARMRSRLLCGTWEPVIPMPREPRKGKPPKRVSTDAGYRDGATCSSEEGPVMGLERRGCPIRPETARQPAMGGPR